MYPGPRKRGLGKIHGREIDAEEIDMEPFRNRITILIVRLAHKLKVIRVNYIKGEYILGRFAALRGFSEPQYGVFFKGCHPPEMDV